MLTFRMSRDVGEPSLDPPESEPPVCPVCGAETDEFIADKDGEIFGCANCIKRIDAWDYTGDD